MPSPSTISVCSRCKERGLAWQCETGKTTITKSSSGVLVEICITGIQTQTGVVYRSTLGGEPIIEEIAKELKNKPIGSVLTETDRRCPIGEYLVSHSSTRSK
jgi:hypothetical protein